MSSGLIPCGKNLFGAVNNAESARQRQGWNAGTPGRALRGSLGLPPAPPCSRAGPFSAPHGCVDEPLQSPPIRGRFCYIKSEHRLCYFYEKDNGNITLKTVAKVKQFQRKERVGTNKSLSVPTGVQTR